MLNTALARKFTKNTKHSNTCDKHFSTAMFLNKRKKDLIAS